MASKMAFEIPIPNPIPEIRIRDDRASRALARELAAHAGF
jgi:hypothetical protein